MGGQTWADFHSQLRTLATVPLTDHMTKLSGKTFSGLLGSLLSDQENRRAQSWVSGLEIGLHPTLLLSLCATWGTCYPTNRKLDYMVSKIQF